MTKTRPCRTAECPFDAMKGRQRCVWHWLLSRPIAEQVKAAERRLSHTPEGARRSRVPADRWPAGGRWCAGCQSMIPLFYTTGSRCRACASRAAHASSTKAKYGLEPDEYDELLALQGGRCAICRQVPRAKRMALDHDHQTLDNRGLLCGSCNHRLLGAAHDSVELLYAAIAYLENPPLSGRWVAPPIPSTKKPGAPREDAGLPPF